MAGGGGIGGPAFAKYTRFMRYLPFLGFPILMFFPSGMTLYWSVVSFLQLLITLLTRSRFFKRLNGMEGHLEGTLLHKQYLKQKELDQQALQFKTLSEKPKTPVEPSKKEPLKVEEGVIIVKNESGQKIEVFDKKPKKHTN
jgi:membrane protein insertase Oxa1/YidC/SpoIIIJ